MKKYILMILVCCVAAVSSQAQDKRLQVVLKNGSSVEYNMSDVDYLSFKTVESSTPTEDNVAYVIDVPTDFSSNRIIKVLADGNKVAEVCREYVLACDKVLTVVYPMGDDGKADLTKGINAADGGSVVWDASTNKATLTEGTGEVAQLYLYNGNLTLTKPEGIDVVETQQLPDLLYDNRTGMFGVVLSTVYKTVKIGTQYWMAQNLSTSVYRNGETITCYKGTEGEAWNANTSGACHVWDDNTELLDVYGYLYNAYAISSDNGLAPDGWEIPTTDQWNALKTAANKKPGYLKSDDMIFWGEETAGTNETGFDVYPCGYFTNSLGDNADNEAWFWSSTNYYDSLSRGTVWDYVRITTKGTNIVISSGSSFSTGHSPEFGHSVRCIRK